MHLIMNRYFVAGLFIIFLVGIMVLIGFWLIFGIKNIQYNTYNAFFNESVAGLNANASINYNGVNVGKVKNIAINTKDPNIVIVTLEVEQHIPIYENTYATIVSQGITGRSYITLSLDNTQARTPLLPHNTPPFPSIKTKRSMFSMLTHNLEEIATEVRDITHNLHALLSKENITHINQTIKNIDGMTQHINHLVQTVNQQSLPMVNNTILPALSETIQSINQTSASLNTMITSLNNQTLQGINNATLPALSNTLNAINDTTQSLNALLLKLNDNPSILIRGERAAQQDPGE